MVHLLTPFKKVSRVLKDLSFDTFNSIHYWRHNLGGNKIPKTYFSGKSNHPPIVLIQGFMGTRGVLLPLENYLKSIGRDVVSIDLGVFNLSDIRASAQLLSYKVERILDRYSDVHGFKKVHLIGHSMGGLIGLYYLKRLEGYRQVEKLIALGTPFHGTWSSIVGLLPFGLLSRGIWQMLPNSLFLRELHHGKPIPREAEIISIAAKFDAVCPPKTCHLSGAINETLDVGHAGLLMDSEVFRSVIKHLDRTDLRREENRVISIRHKRKSKRG